MNMFNLTLLYQLSDLDLSEISHDVPNPFDCQLQRYCDFRKYQLHRLKIKWSLAKLTIIYPLVNNPSHSN